jgi:WhiB family redox-sensing transcriptional regulator
MDWRDHAKCRGEDPELFFPVGSGDVATSQGAHAKQVCFECSVREPCLEWATVNGPMAGVWGGTTEEERAAERRRRGRVNAAARRAARERAAASA